MRNILLILSVILVGLLIATMHSGDQNPTVFQAQSKAPPDQQMNPEKSIGGSFTLTDQNGKSVTDKDYHGKLMIVFLGFTHCPDICPISTATISKAMGLLGAQADSVAPLFITIDPVRDTPATLKSYLSSFDHHMIGLTGTGAQIKQVVDEYKAYVGPAGSVDADDAKAPDDDAGDADKDTYGKAGDYSLDHSGFIYLMDKSGHYITHFPYDAPPEEIVDAVKSNL